MNSRQLQYAIALSRTRNFSQVAEQLNITQPALSKQILNLEAELGVKLFDRNTSPLTLTSAGEHFIREARDLLYKEDQLLRSMERFKSGEAGQLTIGITPFRCSYMIADVVQKVRKEYPGIQVKLHEAGSAVLRKEAAEGKYDFAVVNLPVDESIFEITPLEPDRLVLAVPAGLRHLLPEEIPESGLDFSCCRTLPFVVVGQNQEMRRLFDNLCAAADFIPDIAAEVISLTTAWTMARAGVAATLLPSQFLRSGYLDDQLLSYPLKNAVYSRQPVVVTRRGQYVSEAAAFAIESLKSIRA